MNGLLAEIYSTVIPSGPYLIAAYVLLLAILFVFLGMVYKRVKHAEMRLDALEEESQEVSYALSSSEPRD